MMLFYEVLQLFAEAKERFGVYIHIPFCSKRCDYCAFASWDNRAGDVSQYHSAVMRDLAQASMPIATSVFVGGGTPSLLSDTQLQSLLQSVPRTADAEVTIECNPETLDDQKIDEIAEAGFNRVSIGVQSMNLAVLRALGRQHDPQHIQRILARLGVAGITNVSVDLMFGVEGQTSAIVRQTKDTLMGSAMPPTHVSAYALTVEEGTALADDPTRVPNDDEQASQYEEIDALLCAAGFVNYEISSWAQPGFACRHNVQYWAQGEYAAFGVSAHAHLGGKRSWITSDLDEYFSGVRQVGTEALDIESQKLERLELALRTCIGVPKEAFLADDLELLQEYFDVIDDRVVLNLQGRLLANEFAIRLQSA